MRGECRQPKTESRGGRKLAVCCAGGDAAESVSKGRARLSERAVERGVGFDQPEKWERIRIRQRTALPALRSQAKEASDGPYRLCLFHSFETVSAVSPYHRMVGRTCRSAVAVGKAVYE